MNDLSVVINFALRCETNVTLKVCKATIHSKLNELTKSKILVFDFEETLLPYNNTNIIKYLEIKPENIIVTIGSVISEIEKDPRLSKSITITEPAKKLLEYFVEHSGYVDDLDSFMFYEIDDIID